MRKKEEKIKLGNFTWHIFNKPSAKKLATISETFRIPHEYMKEAMPQRQRAKFIKEADYIFMVLTFPFYNQKTKLVERHELDIFWGNNYLITIHDGNSVLKSYYSQLTKDKHSQKIYHNHPCDLLADIIEDCLRKSWRILNEIDRKITDISQHVIDQNSNKIFLTEILKVKNRVTKMKKLLHNQRKIVDRLIQFSLTIQGSPKLQEKFDMIIDIVDDIWDDLESYSESIDSISQTYESATSYKLNQIVKALTVLSAMVLPATLMAGILGMNLVPVHYSEDPMYLFMALLAMLGISFILYIIFKLKKWL